MVATEAVRNSREQTATDLVYNTRLAACQSIQEHIKRQWINNPLFGITLVSNGAYCGFPIMKKEGE